MATKIPTLSESSNLAKSLQDVESIEDMAVIAVKVCAEAAQAEICTFWRRYVDQNDNPRLRLAAAFGVGTPTSLAQEVTYAIVPEHSGYDGIGVTG